MKLPRREGSDRTKRGGSSLVSLAMHASIIWISSLDRGRHENQLRDLKCKIRGILQKEIWTIHTESPTVTMSALELHAERRTCQSSFCAHAVRANRSRPAEQRILPDRAGGSQSTHPRSTRTTRRTTHRDQLLSDHSRPGRPSLRTHRQCRVPSATPTPAIRS